MIEPQWFNCVLSFTLYELMTHNRQKDTPAQSAADFASSPPLPAQEIAPQRRNPQRPRGLKPSFQVLLGLTLLTAVLLLPFAFSSTYLETLRSRSVDLHGLLRGAQYKQITGMTALVLVGLEMLLTARKRSRNWMGRLKIPGSMQFWRSFHIFLGVALVALVLIHTLGANGFNFNAWFLWVFWGTTLTALVGVVAETGILESSRQFFGKLPGSNRALTKGPLIRTLRSLWLASHIFLVGLFLIMLVFHVLLVYYHRGLMGFG